MEENDQNKSEQPTSFKLLRARRKGMVARSMDLSFLVGISALLLWARFAGPELGTRMAQVMRDALSTGPQTGESGAVLAILPPLLGSAVGPLAGLCIILFAGVLLFEIVQTGIVFSVEPLKPDFSRLNPMNGLKKLFSARLLIETVKTVLKFIVYVAVALLVVKGALHSEAGSVEDSLSLLRFLAFIAGRLLLAFALVALLFAAADQILVRRMFLRKMRMSRRELKREMRDREGDPRQKQKRRQLHAGFVQASQSLANLRGADVLITNPEHIAIALRYDSRTMTAPAIVSLGIDQLALRLRRLALMYGVVVIENRMLARTLLRGARLTHPIPEQCYGPVAEIYNDLRRHGLVLRGAR